MPPLTTLEQELAEEEKVLRAEQEWFLTTQVTPSLDAIQKALVACQDSARLQDDVMGALTLAISSPNNDTLKGFVTLSGSFIVKGELTIKLPKLLVVKAAIHAQIPANISAAQSLLTASNASTTGGGASSSSASSITGALGGGGTGETSPEEPHATTTEGAEAFKVDDGQGSHQLPTTAQGLVAALGAATGIGAGSLIATAPTSTPATVPSLTSTTVIAGSGTPSVPTPQMNTHQVLHSYRPPGHVTQPYALEQLRDVQNHTAQAIFRLEDYRKWRGEATNVGEGATLDIKEITRALKTMLELLERHIRASIEAMAQPGKEKLYPFRVCDPKIFSPALSEDFVIEFYIRDSQLVCAAYALQLSSGSGSGQSSSTGNVLTNYLQHALPGASSTSGPSLPHAVQSSSLTSTAAAGANAGASSGSSSDHHHPSALSALVHNGHTGSGGGGGGRGGHGTPRSSPPPHHHNGTSGHPSHASHQSHLTQHSGQGGNGGVGGRTTKPWSPTRSPSTPQISHHPEPVVLPTSDKIGQTSKGGINKYRGKIATTIEDKVVQVQSPKLAEISARLIQAENLCRRLLHFLVLQDSVAASPY
ncbi:hypothetical protein BGZ47_008240 [Haplosporangium gracile]|nr:hypothetical protein BGZ47_008240 [Haplosporangium gracile]